MISRELAFRERFVVETADGMNDVFLLAVVLAIDAIHDERRERNRSGFGGVGGPAGGGVLGRAFSLLALLPPCLAPPFLSSVLLPFFAAARRGGGPAGFFSCVPARVRG